MADKLKITLVKSTIGAVPKHKKTVEALGLRKLNKTVEMPDNAAVRGMIQQGKTLSESRRNLIQFEKEVPTWIYQFKTSRRLQTER